MAISVLRKPDEYVPVSTWLTNLSLVAALWPLDAFSTSSIVAMSRPTDVPNAIASLVAASAVADRKLLASFIACAMPGRSPTWNRRSLRPASTGSASRQASGRPGVHHRQRPRPGSRGTSGHRRVDVADLGVGEQIVDQLRRRRARPSTCRSRARTAAVGRLDDRPHHGLGHRAVGQAQHDDFGARWRPRPTSSTNAAPSGLRAGPAMSWVMTS